MRLLLEELRHEGEDEAEPGMIDEVGPTGPGRPHRLILFCRARALETTTETFISKKIASICPSVMAK
jgi:hypothetical protein